MNLINVLFTMWYVYVLRGSYMTTLRTVEIYLRELDCRKSLLIYLQEL